MVGTGFSGLVISACLAEIGNEVCCVNFDIDESKRLEQGHIPLHEPRLSAIARENGQSGRLNFASVLNPSSSIYILAIPQATGDSGDGLASLLIAAKKIGQSLAAGHAARHAKNDIVTIAIATTVPVGTSEQVRQIIDDELTEPGIEVDVVVNPEFLKEGSAVDDFLNPDRIIIGAITERSKRLMKKLYQPLLSEHQQFISMSPRDAEFTKYAANAMLATRISFMNEMANLAEPLKVDIEQVRQGIGSDDRIGFSYLKPGCGYAGPCVPQDIQTLIDTGSDHGCDLSLLSAVANSVTSSKNHAYLTSSTNILTVT